MFFDVIADRFRRKISNKPGCVLHGRVLMTCGEIDKMR